MIFINSNRINSNRINSNHVCSKPHMFKIGQRPKVESVNLVQAVMTLITGGFRCILRVSPVRKVSS